MSARTRRYTFKVSLDLPPTRKLRETRTLSSFVFDVPDTYSARVEWFKKHLPTAQANGLRVDPRFTQKMWNDLPLKIERIAKGEL